MKRETGFPLAHPRLRDDPKTEPLELVLDTESPEFTGDTSRTGLDIQRRFYQTEARRMLDLMEQHAPGGFMVQFLGELLFRHSNVFRVLYPTPSQPQPDPLDPIAPTDGCPSCASWTEVDARNRDQFRRDGMRIKTLTDQLEMQKQYVAKALELIKTRPGSVAESSVDGVIEFTYRLFIMPEEVQAATSAGMLLDAKAIQAADHIAKTMRDHFKVSPDDPGVPFE